MIEPADRTLLELSLKELDQANRALAAMEEFYGAAPQTQAEREEFGNNEQLRAWAVMDDLVATQTELIANIRQIDPNFKPDNE
ncbi:MAG TPA: hypothetical protein VGJ20_30995 [Xanthobacteraceae bacterium]|jgi:hypothetical protein